MEEREIKFRVWDDSVSAENKYCYFTLDEMIGRSYFGSWDERAIRSEKEQYTGLKDKNRNDAEVYQGDIYKWVGIIFPITIEDFHGYRFMFGKDQLCKAFIANGEYLGNIHENKELLS